MFFNKSNVLRDRLSEKTAKALVLTCMDFRFVNDTVQFLNKEYKDDYNTEKIFSIFCSEKDDLSPLPPSPPPG